MVKTISIRLKKPNSLLSSFGIYGRDFEKDGMEPSSSPNYMVNKVFIGLLVVLAVAKLLNKV